MIPNRTKDDLVKTGSFFYTQNQGEKAMDIVKLCEKVLEDEDVKDIPLVYVYAVVYSVINAISSGECFYKTEFE